MLAVELIFIPKLKKPLNSNSLFFLGSRRAVSHGGICARMGGVGQAHTASRLRTFPPYEDF